jgi:uncharacterized protein YkwD
MDSPVATRTSPNSLLLLGCALLLVLAVAALGPGASRASAAGACGKWGDVEAQKLRNGEARKAILCLVNKQRDKAGLPSLDRDKRLQKAAQRHTDRMDGTGCFDHACGGEGDLGQRLEQVGCLEGGLSRWAYGENIAWGAQHLGTPEAIVKAWMNSSGHRANILSRDFREIGVGFAVGTPNDGRDAGGIYTTDFGLRVG